MYNICMSKIVPQVQTSIAYLTEHPLLFFRNLSSDVILTAIGVAILAGYGFYSGKQKLISLLISLYLGAILFTVFPYMNVVTLFKQTPAQLSISRIIIFALFVIAFEFILRKIVAPTFSFSKIRSWLDIVLLSSANIATLIVIGYKLLGFSSFYQPTIIGSTILASTITFFWTMVGSLVILYFTSK